MEINKEMLKGYIDAILMSLLANRSMYGYELAKTVREMSDETFELKEGTLYLSLKRLEKKGYVISNWNDGNSGGGRRKYYKPTECGISYIQDKKSEWKFMKNLIDKFIGEV